VSLWQKVKVATHQVIPLAKGSNTQRFTKLMNKKSNALLAAADVDN
jgi:hypothetical protein